MSLVSAGNSKQCSCGSNSTYLQCCGQFIDGLSLPITPEALMRSRYTAYTLADIAYIKKTMRGKATIGFDETEAGHWAAPFQIHSATPPPFRVTSRNSLGAARIRLMASIRLDFPLPFGPMIRFSDWSSIPGLSEPNERKFLGIN